MRRYGQGQSGTFARCIWSLRPANHDSVLSYMQIICSPIHANNPIGDICIDIRNLWGADELRHSIELPRTAEKIGVVCTVSCAASPSAAIIECRRKYPRPRRRDPGLSDFRSRPCRSRTRQHADRPACTRFMHIGETRSRLTGSSRACGECNAAEPSPFTSAAMRYGKDTERAYTPIT